MLLSIVVPVYNEQENIKPLLDEFAKTMGNIEHEIIFVDDGSTDTTKEEILAHSKEHISLIAFSRNFGQTSAMAAGIEAATGKYIATIDGDLQNDPADIHHMLEIIKTGNYDVVAGRRLKRQDGMFLTKIPSKIANWIIRKVTKVEIRDSGCTLKLFTANIAKKLDLYGELHRFIPILADIKGAKIIEVNVKHHPRKFGYSKYNIFKTFKVISDLLLMLFFQKYRQKPMHLFGNIGGLMFLSGSLIEVYLLFLKISGQSIGGRPLFYIGILLLITSIQLVTTGFIAELLMRTYYGSQKEKPYVIAKTYKNGTQFE
jgi:dolichol-phosphate mannosyltransferase